MHETNTVLSLFLFPSKKKQRMNKREKEGCKKKGKGKIKHSRKGVILQLIQLKLLLINSKMLKWCFYVKVTCPLLRFHF